MCVLMLNVCTNSGNCNQFPLCLLIRSFSNELLYTNPGKMFFFSKLTNTQQNSSIKLTKKHKKIFFVENQQSLREVDFSIFSKNVDMGN